VIASIPTAILIGFATALGCGLLIGIERERRKGVGATRGFAGVRTFALVSVTGALAAHIGIVWLITAALIALAALIVISHWRADSRDPGITTEVALISTYLNGVLAMSQPAIAAGIAIVIVALLFMRSGAQRFATNALSEIELADAIILLALALILLPLLPDRVLREYVPINPHRAMRLVVLISAIQAFGYVMLRVLGGRLGIPLSGLISGFVSSSATHAAMAKRARETPTIASACLSATAFSNIATATQAIAITTASAPGYVKVFAPLLGSMALTAAIAGLIAFRRIEYRGEAKLPDHAFSLKQAAVFASLLTFVSAVTLAFQREWGQLAASLSVLLSALVDVHVAIGSLLAAAIANPEPQASFPLVPTLLLCLTINNITKATITFVAAGPSRYTFEVSATLIAVSAAPWVVWRIT
jgi:uncharacterized membrane protein (DUF4010 family)